LDASETREPGAHDLELTGDVEQPAQGALDERGLCEVARVVCERELDSPVKLGARDPGAMLKPNEPRGGFFDLIRPALLSPAGFGCCFHVITP
jgi:hypothetical protein